MDQDLCRRLFLRLVQPGEGTEDTKRRVSYRELLPDDPARAEAVRKLVQSLASRDSRLITTVGSNATDGAVEVAHEALIRGWTQLRRWVDAERAGLRIHRRLTEDAKEWAAAGPEPKEDFLYSGARLAVCREWVATHRDELNPIEGAFLAASLEFNRKKEEMDEQVEIERRADEIYRSFNPEEQGICRRIFLHLVQLGEGTEHTKRRVSYRELLPQDPERAEAVRKVLLRLADPKARLITTTGADVPEAEGSVEVAHEALIRHWSELRKWIDAEIEFLRSWATLRATARRWKKEDRRRDLLLPKGRPLAEAEDLLLCHESELDPDDIAYARTSITKNNRRGLYNWISISLCLCFSVPTLLWAGNDLASVDSARTAYNKMLHLDITNIDIIWGWILTIPPWVVPPLWVTYRKWRGRPEFETIRLDKAFWAVSFILYLIINAILVTLMISRTVTGVLKFTILGLIPFYTILTIVAAMLLWKNARVGRYYRQRRNNLCKFEIVRIMSSRFISKAGLTFASFIIVMSEIFGLLVLPGLPGLLGRQYALELYQAHREIADYQIRDGQFERALDSLNRAHALNFLRRDDSA